jgi:hypothetical protein
MYIFVIVQRMRNANENKANRVEYITNVAPVNDTVKMIEPVGSPLYTVNSFDYPASTVIGVPVL